MVNTVTVHVTTSILSPRTPTHTHTPVLISHTSGLFFLTGPRLSLPLLPGNSDVSQASTDNTGAVILDGSTTVQVASPPAGTEGSHFGFTPAVQDGSFSVGVTAAVAKNEAGYLFAKTSLDGSQRYYALFAGRTSTTLYYNIRTSPAFFSASFNTRLGDGRYHRVLLSVDSNIASLYVDGSVVDAVVLNGLVDDCGAIGPNCAFHLGGRANGEGQVAFEVTGLLAEMAVYSQVALLFDPSPVAPLDPLTLPNGMSESVV